MDDTEQPAKNSGQDTQPAATQPKTGGTAETITAGKAEGSKVARPAIKAESTAAGNEKTGGSRRGSFFVWLFLLLVLAGAGASVWWLWQQGEQRFAALDNRLQQVEQDRSTGAVDNAELLSGQVKLEENLKQWRTQQEQMLVGVQQSLGEQRRRLAEMTTTDRGDWLLAEAEYLMRLANQRLLLGGDTESSVALLQAADNIFLEMDRPSLHQVRAAVASDIAALRATGTPDTEGTWLRIEAVIGQVAALPMFVVPRRVEATPVAPVADSWRARFGAGMRAALDKLSQMLVIRRRETVYEPLVAPEWEHLARQNLRLVLEQAQASLLTGNGDLYRASLEKANHWLTTYFKLNERGVQSIEEELAALGAVSVTRNLPDISGSLTVLKAHINQLHQASAVAPAAPASAQAIK